MHCVKTCSDVTSIFANTLIYPSYRYPSNFSKSNFAFPKYLSHKSRYKISIRCPSLWKNILSSTEKKLQEPSLLKAKWISKLLKMDDEVKYFLGSFIFLKFVSKILFWGKLSPET